MALPNKNPQLLRVAVFGDITGVAGRVTAQEAFLIAREEWQADLIIANGENASHGFGLTPKHAQEIKGYGADLITMGNHTWDKHVLRHRIKDFPYIARPINMPREAPGQGYAIVDTIHGPFAVINALGRQFMNPSDCPFHAVYDKIKELRYKKNITMIGVDFHAEASSEKIIMGHFLDGKASLVWGTHTHVQTADEKILPNGLGYISDLGMTGAEHSVIGFEVNGALKRMIYGEPHRFHPETKGHRLTTGIIADIDPQTGQTVFITRFKKRFNPLENLIEDPNKVTEAEESNE